MEHIVKKSIQLKASAAEVWDALTNPEKTKQYFFNCEVISNWQVESPITFRGRIFLFKKIEMTGEIMQIEPQKLLKYSLKNESDKSGTHSVVTDVLRHHEGITTLSITDDVGPGPGSEDRVRRSDKAWDKVLSGLKELVES
ncbi:MAG: hypothetical protein K0S33_3932 [Bacteroidetes bacterium]|jgi:uncharacterized protein YndB with AHSA1/START domain|nr:hypothetical protein [Bacteroidota bacterium]